jgi:hypothetical protein
MTLDADANSTMTRGAAFAGAGAAADFIQGAKAHNRHCVSDFDFRDVEAVAQHLLAGNGNLASGFAITGHGNLA